MLDPTEAILSFSKGKRRASLGKNRLLLSAILREFEIKESNNWIISGSFKVGENIGYIFIKTNAI